jgi:endogenous inhibitor of DNA gyrase (YacG/DUF329 family)
MKIQCPVCKEQVEWSGNLFRPFCSFSCKQRDLGNWATEKYRIPDEGGESSPQKGQVGGRKGEEEE